MVIRVGDSKEGSRATTKGTIKVAIKAGTTEEIGTQEVGKEDREVGTKVVRASTKLRDGTTRVKAKAVGTMNPKGGTTIKDPRVGITRVPKDGTIRGTKGGIINKETKDLTKEVLVVKITSSPK